MSLQYYSRNTPNIGELVLVHFTKRNDKDCFFEAKLLEYDLNGIMIFHDATKKRKIYSWNKVVPLNKKMVAQVDDINIKNMIQLSIAYLSDDIEREETTQEQLLNIFNENKLMENFISSLCKKYNFEYSYIWTSLVHYIDKLRNEESLWKYFTNNLDNWIIETELSKEISDAIKKHYESQNKNYKIVSKFGLVSTEGINKTKDFLRQNLDLNYKYTLKYQTAPYYLFETWSEDSNKEDHEEFIKKLEKNKGENFIKIDYIAKTL